MEIIDESVEALASQGRYDTNRVLAAYLTPRGERSLSERLLLARARSEPAKEYVPQVPAQIEQEVPVYA